MAIPAMLLFGAQVGGGLLSADQTLRAGKIQEQELKYAADQEVINARLSGNERLERLLDSMSANNAALGGRGVTSEGSFSNILESDYKKFSNEELTNVQDSQVKELSLRYKADAARRISKINAFSSLLGTATNVAKTGFVPKGN